METPVNKTLSSLDFVLVEHDQGAPSPGAAHGPQAVLQLLLAGSPHIQTKSITTISQFKKESKEPTPHAKSLEQTLETCKTLRDSVSKSLQQKHFTVVLSGDHSTAIGTIAGIKTAFPSLEIGVVWFDAHTDIHSPYTTHSGNLHGMPLSAATQLDNTADRRQVPTDFEKKLWKEMKSLAPTKPMIELENIVFVGIRDMEEEEQNLVRGRDCLILDAEYVQNQTSNELVIKIKHHLRHCDIIYVSFDIDCLDKSIVPGTGTPVENGPDAQKVLDIVSQLSVWERVVCFELSEVNPALDPSGKTTEIATKVAHKALSFLS
ncbi:MAG: arginase [Proteobacteria bacterium]|nr:arginase [Pseudomonadota bacterium]